MKKCNKCLFDKELNQFNSNPKTKDKLQSSCKVCEAEYKKQYRIKNKDKISLKMKQYQNSNRERVNKISREYRKKKRREKGFVQSYNKVGNSGTKEYYIDYYRKNKNSILKKTNKRNKEKRGKDPLFKLKCNIRSNINDSLRRSNYKKITKTQFVLGCSYFDFKSYIESKWEDWMNWDNYGKYNGSEKYGWDLDHIIPTSSAKTEQEMIDLNYHTNFQPLCSKINRDIKRNHLPKNW
jgi:hypothetical protein